MRWGGEGTVLSFHTSAEFHIGRGTVPAFCGFEGRKQRGSYGGGYWIPRKILEKSWKDVAKHGTEKPMSTQLWVFQERCPVKTMFIFVKRTLEFSDTECWEMCGQEDGWSRVSFQRASSCLAGLLSQGSISHIQTAKSAMEWKLASMHAGGFEGRSVAGKHASGQASRSI